MFTRVFIPSMYTGTALRPTDAFPGMNRAFGQPGPKNAILESRVDLSKLMNATIARFNRKLEKRHISQRFGTTTVAMFFLSVALCSCMHAAEGKGGANDSIKLNVDEVHFGVIGPTDEIVEFKVAPGNHHLVGFLNQYDRRLASMSEREMAQAKFSTIVVVDGKPQKCLSQGLGSIVFSEDGTRYAYAVGTERGFEYIVDGEAQPPVDFGMGGVFSRNGASFAFGGLVDGKGALCVDGNLQTFPGKYIMNNRIRFSPDASSVVYLRGDLDDLREFQRTQKFVTGDIELVLDHQPVLSMKGMAFEPMFSPDGKHLAIVEGSPKEGMQLYVDGEPVGERFNRISGHTPLWNQQGTKVVWGTEREGRWYLNTRDSTSTALEGVGYPKFFRDGDSYACTARLDGDIRVIVDGKTAAHDIVGFTTNGKSIAYIRKTADEKYRVEVNEQAGEAFDDIVNPEGSIIFIPQHDQVAYYAVRDNKHHAVIGTDVGPAFKTRIGPIVFSHDGKRSAYGAELDNGRSTVVVDGVPSTDFAELLAVPEFSPDGKHVAYVANDKGNAFICVDGVRTGQYKGIVRDSKIAFADNVHCNVLMTRDFSVLDSELLLRVEIAIAAL